MAKQSKQTGKQGGPVAPVAPPRRVTPVIKRCVDNAMFIPQEKAISVFGTFNGGLLPTTVELGVLDGHGTFQGDGNVTHDPLTAANVMAGEIRVVLQVGAGAADGLKYVRVTQGTGAGHVNGVSTKDIFTLWKA